MVPGGMEYDALPLRIAFAGNRPALTNEKDIALADRTLRGLQQQFDQIRGIP